MNKSKMWTDEENDLLRAWYATKSNAEIGAELGKSETAVSNRLARMRLKRWKFRLWSEAHYDFVRENYVTMTDREMAEALGKTPGGVKAKRVEMKLRRTADDEKTLVKWGEGKAIVSAEDFASGLVGLTAYEVAQRMGARIAEVDACISRLYANGPYQRGWGTAENLAAAKLISLRRDLRAITPTAVNINRALEMA